MFFFFCHVANLPHLFAYICIYYDTHMYIFVCMLCYMCIWYYQYKNERSEKIETEQTQKPLNVTQAYPCNTFTSNNDKYKHMYIFFFSTRMYFFMMSDGRKCIIYRRVHMCIVLAIPGNHRDAVVVVVIRKYITYTYTGKNTFFLGNSGILFRRCRRTFHIFHWAHIRYFNFK